MCLYLIVYLPFSAIGSKVSNSGIPVIFSLQKESYLMTVSGRSLTSPPSGLYDEVAQDDTIPVAACCSRSYY